MSGHTAMIFDVQRFSLHDGPGIRTVVFFKGCALACAWCQNPEAMHGRAQLAYDEARCLEGCTRCQGLCPEGAIGLQRSGRVDFSRCTGCGLCVEACPTQALRTVGRQWGTDELLAEILRDRSFFVASGGGVTFSGGEPALHSGFLRELLPKLKREGVHTCLETAGAYGFALLEPLLGWMDLILYDLKVIDPQRHERYTTRDNADILANLRELLRRGVRLELRMPVIPGWNTDPENIDATARLLRELGVDHLTLLPYNPLWEAKLPRLGLQRRALGIRAPEDAFYARLQESFARSGVEARM